MIKIRLDILIILKSNHLVSLIKYVISVIKLKIKKLYNQILAVQI